MNNSSEYRLINGRYRLDEAIGRGGLGIVFRALDLYFNRVVAVKIIGEESNREGECSYLFSEILAVKKLRHPNIIQILDAGEENDLPYIIMEYIDCQSLHEQIPMREKDVLNIAIGICGALEMAHSQGIIHRDLKPDNFLQTRDGIVKLTDFGLAASSYLAPENKFLLSGTVDYISPEQAFGERIDERSDLYSLGASLYELLCGEVPFPGNDPLVVIAAHRERKPRYLREVDRSISEPFAGIIMRLLEKDPNDRFQSAGALLNALEHMK